MLILIVGALLFCSSVAAGFDPPGKYYSLGTHRMYIHCVGDGPSVVFDSGIGGSSSEWRALQERLVADFRTCAYDRAGYGWSDPGPGLRTTEVIVRELRTLLKKAGVEPPHVLVGHSFGGYTAQYFLRAHPNEVRGVVLVDSAHPRQTARLNTLSGAGAARQSNPIAMPDSAAGTEPSGFLNSRRKAIFAQMSEFRGFAQSGREIEAVGSLVPRPSVVITRGRRAWPEGRHGDSMEAIWRELQTNLAQDLEAEHVIAQGSAHQIHRDQPELVEEAVRRVANAGLRRVAPVSASVPAAP